MGTIKMEKHPFFAVIFCAVFMHKVLGYPYNDVSIACDSMLPDHGSGPQRSTPPYVISVSFDRYDPGNEIQVTLESTSPYGFTGFMAQAREVDGNTPVGMFRIVDSNTQGLRCSNVANSAVSHRNPSVKHRITTNWVAPEGTRKIRIMATFVQDDDIYWTGVHSKTLSPRGFDIANDTEAFNVTEAFNDTMTANSSDIANVTSIVSEITTGIETPDEEQEETDVSTLLAAAEAESETPVNTKKTDESKSENDIRKSRRKSVVTFDIKCGEGGVYQSSSGACVKNMQGSSQSSGKHSEIIVVKQGKGSSSSSGCMGGKVGSVYNQYGCGDAGTDISDQSSYGQSVSTKASSKVYTYPESKPFPPERESTSSKIANSKYSGIIYSKGSKPQSGSSETVRITVQGGQGSPACDKSSSSYNIRVCNQLGQPSVSQSSSSFGAQSGKFSSSSSSIYGQGSRTQSGSSETVRITIQGQPSGSQSSSSYGIQGGSYSNRGSSCGQGTTYDSNPCNQDQASFSSSSSSSSQSSYNNQGQASSYSNQL
ncbi:mucin-21-like [Sceloporus undulatus]|uniref:mucin-21-like n=1 Tax=Sceloporus undulatus TaxID=8520 RepID=UPI001C4BF35C|nr:mucin-21-like [Sceloporus undulatus]